ncbi:MAG: HU family DNA-binding protein [Sedimenticolaceae bacterium]
MSNAENAMNKKELIDAVAAKADLNKTQAEAAVNALVEVVGQSLEDGNPVALVGFGTFDVKARAPRTGRNPKTGEPIEIKGARLPVFKAGKQLKERVDF